MKCPYEQYVIDECSGIKFESEKWKIWHEGYKTAVDKYVDGEFVKQILYNRLQEFINEYL